MKDGGPAFPFVPNAAQRQRNPGMSLRDWFAGQALIGLLGITSRAPDAEAAGQAVLVIGPAAYQLADALLAEREKEA
uniref:Uncharacterized protein n=1 Tax=viral metagenome TaxID=1070528 RepID=A0A6H1Z7K8_9ZZZZ